MKAPQFSTYAGYGESIQREVEATEQSMIAIDIGEGAPVQLEQFIAILRNSVSNIKHRQNAVHGELNDVHQGLDKLCSDGLRYPEHFDWLVKVQEQLSAVRDIRTSYSAAPKAWLTGKGRFGPFGRNVHL